MPTKKEILQNIGLGAWMQSFPVHAAQVMECMDIWAGQVTDQLTTVSQPQFNQPAGKIWPSDVLAAIKWEPSARAWDALQKLEMKSKPGPLGTNSFYIVKEEEVQVLPGDWVLWKDDESFARYRPEIDQPSHVAEEPQAKDTAADIKYFFQWLEWSDFVFVGTPAGSEILFQHGETDGFFEFPHVYKQFIQHQQTQP